MRKLLLLGGSRYLIPVIEKAHELGVYVITCDYLSDNEAHKQSDQYLNISIVDKEAVLLAAQKLKIDGVMSFACDPGVVTAAYVAEKMGLPFQGSYESVCILQDKGLFRQFLIDNDFICPKAKRYSEKSTPFSELDYFSWPVIVKPVDSAGSKGVSKVSAPNDLLNAIDIAVDNSKSGSYIIEDFLEFEGYHSSADFFTIDGKLVFASYSDQLFDGEAANPYTPAQIIWPSSMKREHQNELTAEIQRLMTLLNMKSGIYNIETCIANNGKPYIMEVSPRGGGCKIAELQKLAYGVDLIEAEVRNAVGLPLNAIEQTECHGCWCEMVIHAEQKQSGVLKQLYFDNGIEEKVIVKKDISAKPGDKVNPFTGANMSLGDIFLNCSSREEINQIINCAKEWVHIEVE